MKYKKTLKALKLFIASKLVFLFKNITLEATLLMICLMIIAVTIGITNINISNQIFEGKNNLIDKITNPIKRIKMYNHMMIFIL